MTQDEDNNGADVQEAEEAEVNASVVVDETKEQSSEELPSQVDDETVDQSQEPAEILESDTSHVAAQEGDEDASGSKPSTPQQR
jgi:hypothetical protein